MRKTQVTEALHEGIAKAVRDFHAWSGGGSVRYWGVESLLTVTCAQALGARIALGSLMMMTLEENYQGILSGSGRHEALGRPKGTFARIRDKPTGRVDIVLWNKRDTPRALIEIKRRDARDGLERDARRVIDFLQALGKLEGGSVRYGVVATVLQAARDRPFEHFWDMAQRREAALTVLAKRHGMVLSQSGPEMIRERGDAAGDCRAASSIFQFTRGR